QWNDSNIDTLVHVMECFYRVSGLRINLCKSKIMGIHVDADRIKSAASKLGCLVLNTPFLYLGTKVGENMSRVHALEKEIHNRNGDNTSFWKDKCNNEGILKDVSSIEVVLEEFNSTIFFQVVLALFKGGFLSYSAVTNTIVSAVKIQGFSVKSIRQVIVLIVFPVFTGYEMGFKSAPLNGAESSCHIFFQCNLVRQLARKISSWWNVDYVDVSSYEEWYTWLVSLSFQAISKRKDIKVKKEQKRAKTNKKRKRQVQERDMRKDIKEDQPDNKPKKVQWKT
ncbi:hypothetical protein Tco_1050057, partial [Tanacetum coccineum]